MIFSQPPGLAAVMVTLEDRPASAQTQASCKQGYAAKQAAGGS
jgi:hypothetical protein